MNRKAFRKPEKANRHMHIDHSLSEDDFALHCYKINGEIPVPPSKKAQQPARQKKRKAADGGHGPANEQDSIEEDGGTGAPDWAAHNGIHQRGNEDGEDEDSTGSEESAEGLFDAQTSSENEDTVDSRDGDDDDAGLSAVDALAEMDKQHVWKRIVRHRVADSGATLYRVAWEGTDVQTWEAAKKCDAVVIAAYHAKVVEDEAAHTAAMKKRALAVDATVSALRGGAPRHRRSRRSSLSASDHRKKVLALGDQYEAEGMSYFAAHEKAMVDMSC